MTSYGFENRHARDLAFAHNTLEIRSFIDPEPDESSYRDQCRARYERDPPAPGHELLVVEIGQRKKRRGAEAQAQRKSDLNETSIEAALVGRRVFGRDQHGAAPFPADGDALQKTAGNQQDRSCDTDAGIGGKQADERRCEAHAHQRQDQQRFSAQTIAEVAQDDGSDRSGEKADANRADRYQASDQWILGGEE